MSTESVLRHARLLQSEIDKLGAGPRAERVVPQTESDLVSLYDVVVSSPPLREATRRLFEDGHYSRAVEEACKCLNNAVKAKSRLSADGQALMNQAFSEKNPVLKLNALASESQRNEQIGYMLILGGTMVGIRNPRAHEHELQDSPIVALQLLAMASHLMTRVAAAKRLRKPKKAAPP